VPAAVPTGDLHLPVAQDHSRRIGYQDANAFRRLFRRYTDLSPRGCRQRVGVHRNN